MPGGAETHGPCKQCCPAPNHLASLWKSLVLQPPLACEGFQLEGTDFRERSTDPASQKFFLKGHFCKVAEVPDTEPRTRWPARAGVHDHVAAGLIGSFFGCPWGPNSLQLYRGQVKGWWQLSCDSPSAAGKSGAAGRAHLESGSQQAELQEGASNAPHRAGAGAGRAVSPEAIK